MSGSHWNVFKTGNLSANCCFAMGNEPLSVVRLSNIISASVTFNSACALLKSWRQFPLLQREFGGAGSTNKVCSHRGFNAGTYPETPGGAEYTTKFSSSLIRASMPAKNTGRYKTNNLHQKMLFGNVAAQIVGSQTVDSHIANS